MKEIQKKEYIKPDITGIYYVGDNLLQDLSGWEGPGGTGGGVGPGDGEEEGDGAGW